MSDPQSSDVDAARNGRADAPDDVIARVTVVECLEALLSHLDACSNRGMTRETAVRLCHCDEAMALGLLWSLEQAGFATHDIDGLYRFVALPMSSRSRTND
jgi:hypothetical protein